MQVKYKHFDKVWKLSCDGLRYTLVVCFPKPKKEGISAIIIKNSLDKK